MEKKQWTEALDASGALRCWVAGQSGDIVFVKRAPKPAVTLKTKPLYDIDDDSRIDICETVNSINSELTARGFSESGIQASLAGGAYGLTGGLAGDIGWRKEKTSKSSKANTATRLHCSYYFPRVTVTFDKDSLELSKACEDKLAEFIADNALTEEKFTDFFRTFGGVFAKDVSLGGRLYGTEAITGASESQILERKNELKYSLSATFQAPFVGISLGGHHAKGSDTSSSITTSSGRRGASIVAHGGNSLLSFNPELWAPTVESYHNWRTIQQENIVDLPTLLSEITDDNDKHKKAIKNLQTYIQTQQEAAKPKDMIRVMIGNKWRMLSGHGSYLARWEFFLSSTRPEIVKQVTVHLDPTFIKPEHVFVRAKGEEYMRPVSITGSTSGVFTVMADVKLIDGWNWKELTSDMNANVGKRLSEKNMRLFWRLGTEDQQETSVALAIEKPKVPPDVGQH
ncbi:hypothetical protein N7523_002505 [Penicillium sp. IBT 18751x]|nr:hypothetical protein N7523_002505 [Penicillium sp. IBT 18751x]